MRSKYDDPKWINFRIWVINCHVGIPLRHGLIGKLRKLWPGRPHIIFAVEVRDAAVLRKALGKGWEFWPWEQPGEHRKKEAMTYLCVRNPKRWTWLDKTNRELKPSQYPRRLTAGVLKDKKTGRVFNLSVLHPDPLGRGLARANEHAMTRHVRQVVAYRDWHLENEDPEAVSISAGDVNEGTTFEDLYRYRAVHRENVSAVGLFQAANMRPAHWGALKKRGSSELMEAFVTLAGHVVVNSWTTAKPRVKGLDHVVLKVVLGVKVLR
jgi:hypothetical protein